ncbi:MAG: hypothetical protein AAFX78_12770 [Cyanobacteria bacterium J06638_20]
MLNLSFVQWLVILSALIGSVGAVVYMRDTLLGRTKPNRVTWAMWALAPLVGFAASLASGADIWAITRVFFAGFLPLLVLLTSFANAQSYWKITTFDWGCGSLSLAALIVWQAVDAPKVAILLAIAGDAFAAIPTLTKAWKFPETETGLFFVASCLSSLLVLPAIPVWTIENAAFPLYLASMSGIVLFSIYRKQLVGG